MATQTPTRRKLTPPQYAKQLGVDCAKVLKWIRSGELKAADFSTNRGQKPRFLIDTADILTFELSRQVQPPPPKINRRRPRDPSVIQFF